MSELFGTLAGIGMAVGPPLIYADQAYSIVKKKDSSGFSHDVCGVILVANIIRIFFWLGNRFELPLLFQSLLLIVAHLGLLSICLHYMPHSYGVGSDRSQDQSASYAPLSPVFDAAEPSAAYEARAHQHSPGGTDGIAQEQRYSDHARAQSTGHGEQEGQRFLGPGGGRGGADKWKAKLGGGLGALNPGRWGNGRPWDFWQWEGYGIYLEFLAGLILVLGFLQMIFGRWMWYIDMLGFMALILESTLPIPQFLANYRRKSCYGFRSSTLAGWLFGDLFKTAYFFVRGAPVQFKVTAIITVCWDIGVAVQRWEYGAEPPVSARGGSGAGGEEGQSLRLGN